MGKDGSYDERLLLEAVSRGDERSFQLFFDTFRPGLFAYISKFVKSVPVAEELVMDIFTKLWVGRDLLTQIDDMDAFLFRIARNKSIDFLRSVARDPRFEELLWEQMQPHSAEDPDARLMIREFEEMLSRAIQLLSPQRKKVYEMSRKQEMTHDQIAAELQISKATVNNHIVEAQRFIKNYLGKNLDLTLFFLFCHRL